MRQVLYKTSGRAHWAAITLWRPEANRLERRAASEGGPSLGLPGRTELAPLWPSIGRRHCRHCRRSEDQFHHSTGPQNQSN